MPDALRNQLGIAIAKRTYKAYRAAQLAALAAHLQCRRPAAAAALGQHRHQGPAASDVLYIKALAAPFTVNTMPEGTLKALADHGELAGILPADGGDCEEVLAQFATAGMDLHALAARLQTDGAASFVKSWHSLMAVIASKSASLTAAT